MEQDDLDMRKGMIIVFAGIVAMFLGLLYLANSIG
jgi:hypothetical protein